MVLKFQSSRDILIEFNKEFITGGGDITKMLRSRGYEVSYCQSYLDEFDFSLRDPSELRDGVRLTKLAEILLGNNNLCNKLRVPAISSLQKKFNVEVTFSAFINTGYKLPKDIKPKNITEGHKEKTLSFLWYLRGIIQERAVYIIVTKWREYRLCKNAREKFLKTRTAVVKIQNWYRKSKCLLKNRQEVEKVREARTDFIKLRSAARIIQKKFRAKLQMRLERRRTEAAVCIQKWYRNKLNQKKGKYPFQVIQRAAITIQRVYRQYHQRKSYKRTNLLALNKAVIFLQSLFRRKVYSKIERQIFLKKRSAAVVIQRWFRATILTRKCKVNFFQLKLAAVVFQRRYKAKKVAQAERLLFLQTRSAVLTIQRRLRATQQSKKDRQRFLQLKSAAVIIQRRYRKLREHQQSKLLKRRQLETAAIKIQVNLTSFKFPYYTRAVFPQPPICYK